MDLWSKARVFAEEAAKRSQEMISLEATKAFVSEASKKADQIKAEALKRAEQIKTLAGDIPIPPIPALRNGSDESESNGSELERFGVTEELREFVKGITIDTFKDFPIQDEPEISDVPAVSNVRQDLNEWQTKHATLVLSSVKEISKFRYELCPRYMKEQKFWRIYFILVNTYTSQFEQKYFEECKLNLEKKEKEGREKEESEASSASNAETRETKLESSKSSTAEQDLDVFLLGDLGSSDDEADAGGDIFEDDFDKDDDKALDSEDDTGKSASAKNSEK